MKTQPVADTWIGVGLFVFAVIVHQYALDFTSMEDVAGVGAEVFPRVFARALMVLAACLTFSSLLRPGGQKPPSFAGLFRVLTMAALCYLFLYLLPLVGYALLSPLFAMGATIIATRRFRLWDQVPVLAVVAGIYVIFNWLLKVPLPKGLLG